MHELRVMAAVELHVNATYYSQHPALKSVSGKSESVVGGYLSSSYSEPAQCLQDSKTSDLNCSPRYNICIIFMCYIIIIT